MPSNIQYTTILEPRFGALERMDLPAIAADVSDPVYSETLCRVNEAVVRLGVLEGELQFHKHDNEDEFFYVVEGELTVELEDRRIGLGPGQAVTVPKGLQHRPIAPQRTIVLLVERAGVRPTGD
jgi:mannose-6-phosphate isomerase-like protein (cupin superfamily)